MLRFALRRLLAFPLVILAVYGGAVILLTATPGEGLEAGGRDLSPELLERKRIAFNYDQPWATRYFWTWPKRLVWDRDLPAHQYEEWTVSEILAAALPVSLQLGLLALLLAMCIGITAGVVAAIRPGGWLDHGAVAMALLGISLPTFVVGSLLLIVFAIGLKLAPVGGWGSPAQAILPALTLALPHAAYIARLLRAAMLETLSEDFIRTARAKGLPNWRVLLGHALPNAMLPVLSYLGPAAAAVFTGSFVVERIFAIPGMGTHVVESINNRDQSLILATVLVYSVFLISFNLLVDLLYAWVDPRIRVGTARP